MIRRLLCVLAVVLVPASGQSASALADDWVKVQRALAVSDREEFSERVRQLQARAADCQALRLTPYAEGLVTWASRHPDALGALAVRAARELDPELPSSYFLVARWQWQRAASSGRAFVLAGWWALFCSSRPARCSAPRRGWCCCRWVGRSAGRARADSDVPAACRSRRRGARATRARPANAIVLASPSSCCRCSAAGPTWLLMYLFA
jgi:hypothetical protein